MSHFLFWTTHALVAVLLGSTGAATWWVCGLPDADLSEINRKLGRFFSVVFFAATALVLSWLVAS